MVSTDIIIPCFNQPDFTIKCLESIREGTPESARVILIDNGSAEPSRTLYQSMLETLPRALYVRSPENLGFVKATNIGLAMATAEYVCLLNNDTEVPPGWLEKLQEVLAREPRVALVGPLSSSTAQWQGQLRPFTGYRVLGRHQMLSFFCVLMRRAIIATCGYLSEEYRAGLGDDDDYSAVVHERGWRLALRGDVCVVHHHRSTFREVYGEEGWFGMQRENLEYFKEKWRKGRSRLRVQR